MKAKDIMTSPVITAEPQTPVREIAARLRAHRISGLPVRAVQPAHAVQPMTQEEYGRLLNTLLEAERAGAKLLAAYVDELPPDSDAWAWLCVIQRDEAHNCSVLIHLLLEAGFEPSTAVGDFYRRGLEIRGWRERLRFLNRGQKWVAERIAAALPRLSVFIGRKPLQAMYDSHIVNIGICDKQLKP